MTYDDWKLRSPHDEPTAREYEAFADYFEDWSEEIFIDYLTRSIYAYGELISLLGVAGKELPKDPEELSKEQRDVLYRLAESQDDFMRDFEDWAFEQWRQSR